MADREGGQISGVDGGPYRMGCMLTIFVRARKFRGPFFQSAREEQILQVFRPIQRFCEVFEVTR